ncbi:glucuronyl esterase domain-containing protein [Reichenbachiella agariperforans]|nr:acetylxylan esterase [Reichenbachiella agariperforans]
MLLCVIGGGVHAVQAQFAQADRDSINRYSYLDFQEMKKSLSIEIENRPGPSGDPLAANAANTDESNVRSYSLPNPLMFSDGKKVTNQKDWWAKRRSEIVNDFESEVYGRLPETLPKVNWVVKSVKDTIVGSFPVQEKTMLGIVDNSAFPEIKVEIELVVGTPKEATGPVPVVMEFGFINWPFGKRAPEPNYFMSAYEPLWKQQLLSQGWGYAILVPSSIQADHGAGLKSGIIGLVNKGAARAPEEWGVLRAWAWGASRALDYFEKDADVDQKKIAIEGTSRYGKAALVTMAFDARISLGFIGSSGEGGASIMRRNFGEQVENLASSSEYHWFCGNFIKYASSLTIDDLPVDAHELITLCAPRPVFISAGSHFIEGQWVDAKGMFLAGVHAQPVYQLLGAKGLGTNDFPVLGFPLINGEIAFRQHAGGHSTGPNWSTWIAWAHRYWDK